MAKAKRVGAKALKEMIAGTLAVISGLPPKERAKAATALISAIEAVADAPTRRASSKDSKSWKALERLVATKLRGKRVSRGDDFSRSDVDVKTEFRALRIDAKFRNKHAHHTFVKEIERKYCVNFGDVPLLVTKTPGQQGAYATVPLDHYADLLEIVRSHLAILDLKELPASEEIKRLRFKPFKVRKAKARPPEAQTASTLARVKPAVRGKLHEILSKGRGTTRMTRRGEVA